MDISTGKQAIAEIQRVETELQTRLDTAQRDAELKIAQARRQADDLITDKEKNLAELRKQLSDTEAMTLEIPDREDNMPAYEPGRDIVQSLAAKLFAMLVPEKFTSRK